MNLVAMIKRDFHGYRLDDALQEVELIIGDVRKQGKKEVAELITGHGVIQKQIIELLRDYQLEVHPHVGNSGTLVVNIE